MFANSHECRSCRNIVGLDRIHRRVWQELELRIVEELVLVGRNAAE